MKTTHICVTSGLSFLASSYHTTLHLLPIFNFSNRHTNDQTPSPLIFSHAFMIPLLLCYRNINSNLLLCMYIVRAHTNSLSLSLHTLKSTKPPLHFHQTLLLASIAFSSIVRLYSLFNAQKLLLFQLHKTSTKF